MCVLWVCVWGGGQHYFQPTIKDTGCLSLVTASNILADFDVQFSSSFFRDSIIYIYISHFTQDLCNRRLLNWFSLSTLEHITFTYFSSNAVPTFVLFLVLPLYV